jgi:hypothetical protein
MAANEQRPNPVRAVAVTPSDGADIVAGQAAVALYIGGAGTLSFIDAIGNTVAATVVAGPFPFQVKRVRATGTTATNIIAGFAKS